MRTHVHGREPNSRPFFCFFRQTQILLRSPELPELPEKSSLTLIQRASLVSFARSPETTSIISWLPSNPPLLLWPLREWINFKQRCRLSFCSGFLTRQRKSSRPLVSKVRERLRSDVAVYEFLEWVWVGGILQAPHTYVHIVYCGWRRAAYCSSLSYSSPRPRTLPRAGCTCLLRTDVHKRHSSGHRGQPGTVYRVNYALFPTPQILCSAETTADVIFSFFLSLTVKYSQSRWFESAFRARKISPWGYFLRHLLLFERAKQQEQQQQQPVV